MENAVRNPLDHWSFPHNFQVLELQAELRAGKIEVSCALCVILQLLDESNMALKDPICIYILFFFPGKKIIELLLLGDLPARHVKCLIAGGGPYFPSSSKNTSENSQLSKPFFLSPKAMFEAKHWGMDQVTSLTQVCQQTLSLSLSRSPGLVMAVCIMTMG